MSGCTDSSSSYYYDDYGSYEDEYDSSYDDRVTSENWDCTSDCSGHDAGYEWAMDNDITDPYDCDGNSDSFIEGCEAYANEQQIEAEEEEAYAEEDYYEYDY